MVGMWANIFAEVYHCHSRYNKQMVKRYLEHSNPAAVDVRFLFKTGDKVLLKPHLVGELQVKAIGLYTFS